ncbi:alpha/beta fold hydrolase [Streptomyces sp. NPDC096198]|uniref:alpha/beta fold hydrolase n=1 Tax=Streptomyces sp. NPDC096198 TaxID=3366080 RepID=UPI0037FF54D5
MSDLHYDVRGDGPVLLVVPGGAGHPMGLEPLTAALAGHFTVVTYDPLGLAHGRLGLPVPEQRVADWSEGAHRVLGEVLPDGDAAYVFGFSSAGVAVLDLLARHPERLRRVLAHEPPVVRILPDADRQSAMFAEVYEVYRSSGPEAAGALMAAGLAGTSAPAPGPARPLAPEEELNSPMALFLSRVLPRFTAYEPDLGALAASPPVLAAGTASRGRLLHRTAALAAELTSGGFAEFPGGHLGAVEHPREFAARMVETLLD